MQPENFEQLLAERLNGEPIVFWGYTNSELSLAIKVAGGIAFSSCLTIGLVIGKGVSLLGGGLLLTLGLVALGGKQLQRLKRGKPDFYYQTRLRLTLHRLGLTDSGLFSHRGYMYLGRNRYSTEQPHAKNA